MGGGAVATGSACRPLAPQEGESLERRPVSLEVVLAETQALLARLLPSNITVSTDALPDLHSRSEYLHEYFRTFPDLDPA